MRPATEFRITKYRYSADGAASQNSSVLDLAKGALRMITGLIGQTNRSGYAIVTPTATMGIRGTDHEPAYQPPGASADKDQPPGTYDKVNEGETFIRNEKGQQVTVNRGRVAFMSHDRRTAPRLLQGEPKFYRRHAEIDRRTAARREALHRRIQEQRQLRQQERKEKNSNTGKIKKPRRITGSRSTISKPARNATNPSARRGSKSNKNCANNAGKIWSNGAMRKLRSVRALLTFV